MPRISIIIPVFNAAKYLDRCLVSIIESLGSTSGEVLLIDNDSSDDSLAIMRKIAKRHPDLIKVLQCHTPGAAAVKNFGVDHASGKYIWFIDADDWISRDAISKLLTKADQTGSDLVMMGAERVHGDDSTSDGHKRLLSPVLPSEPNYKSRFVRYGMGPWQLLIRRKWWNEHKFRFQEGHIHEDMELMSALILYTDKYEAIDETLYYYFQNPDSVLHKTEFNPNIFDIFPALDGLYDRFKEAGAEKKYHDELEWFFIWNLLLDSANDFAQFPEGRDGFRKSREMLSQYFPNWRKNRFLREKPLKLRIKVRLNYKR